MRLLEVEKPLAKAILDYITEVYPYTGGERPSVRVLDEEEFKKRSIVKGLPGFYQIRENTLYFRDFASPITVAHEIHHWHQAQELGRERFLALIEYQLSRAWKVMLQYEKEADDIALKNAPRLRWGWPKLKGG